MFMVHKLFFPQLLIQNVCLDTETWQFVLELNCCLKIKIKELL